jgi:hypothetical protein
MSASTKALGGGAALGVALTLVMVFGVSAIKGSTTDAAPAIAAPAAAAPAFVTPQGFSAAPARPAVQSVQPVVVRSSEPTVVREVREVESKPRGRSWKKTAMVIGGSTAAGAGVGGLIGGKKGALVGAAIGGGASTIYESVKR